MDDKTEKEAEKLLDALKDTVRFEWSETAWIESDYVIDLRK